MNGWQSVLVGPDVTIRKSVEVLDASALQIVLVVNEARRLLGTVTDGDIRRGILKGVSLEEPVSSVMNTEPTVARTNQGSESILAAMRLRQLHQIPVLDEAGVVRGLETLDQLLRSGRRENRVVLMAGGIGSRLRPLTNDTPKPMLRVGDRPLLETILENFIEYGFHRFHFSVNYMADVIKDHFRDGSRWGVSIDYLHEDERLGTAGALRLLPERPTESLLVMNGDLLTKINFGHLLDFHGAHAAKGTMCVKEYELQVPYGVVNIDNHRITGVDEKPVKRFFVNAGIYVLEPDALDQVPGAGYFDMPSLFEKMIACGSETAAFPVREYWLDIGQMADYDRANGEFMKVFS